MTSKLFFDADCLSAFLWVNREDILFELYPEKIVLPKQVYDELCHPSIPHFKRKVDRFTQEDKLSIKEILLDTEEYHLYYELAFSPPKGETVISKGEAAAIALAKTYNGIIASSNFRDVAKFARKYNLEHMGAGDILVAAFKAEHIDDAQKRLEEKEVFKADENNYIDYAAFVLESLGIVDGVEVQKI